MKHKLAALGLAMSVAATAEAQLSTDLKNPAPETSNRGGIGMEQPCNYDRCALRITLGFGTWGVARGVEGIPVGKMGIFTAPKLEPLFSEVPAAASEIRHFRQKYFRSAAVIWGGAAVVVGGVAASATQGGNMGANVVGLAGLATMVYGGWLHGKSVDVLSRSIWLYNRALPR